MPYLHRERCDDFVKKASTDDEERLPTSSSATTSVGRIRRSRKSDHQQTENVIISSKYVLENTRERYEADTESDTFWGEFPRTHAEVLERRGVEILVDASERPSHKEISIVSVADSTSELKLSFPAKRTSKGKIVSPACLTTPPWLKTTVPPRPVYFLTKKDLIWLDCYNKFAVDRSSVVEIPKISAEDLERLMSALEVRKNEIVLSKMRFTIQQTNKTTEGTLKRREHEYFALQRFIEATPETFEAVDHIGLGKIFSLSSQTSFDIWEYWKCKVQDGFMQPLVFPRAVEFDYRRISLLAAWNLTSISYAQRLRHDAERIRLMYDLMQKRDAVMVKNTTKEEEILSEVAELCLLPEAKFLSPAKLSSVFTFVQHHSALERSSFTGPDITRAWVESMLKAEEEAAKRALDEEASVSPLNEASSTTTPPKPVVFPLAPLEPAPNIKTGVRWEREAIEKEKKMVKRRPRSTSCIPTSRVITRRTPRTSEMVAEHADNSCCENGPVEEEGGLMVKRGRDAELTSSVMQSVKATDEEPLYMINADFNDSGIVLMELNEPPKKPVEFRTRLRSWKRSPS